MPKTFVRFNILINRSNYLYITTTDPRKEDSIAMFEQEGCYFDFRNPFTTAINFSTKILGQKTKFSYITHFNEECINSSGGE
jgi:hypothetical protein